MTQIYVIPGDAQADWIAIALWEPTSIQHFIAKLYNTKQQDNGIGDGCLIVRARLKVNIRATKLLILATKSDFKIDCFYSL